MIKKTTLQIFFLTIILIFFKQNEAYSNTILSDNSNSYRNEAVEKYLKSKMKLENINFINVNLKLLDSKIEIIGYVKIYNDISNTKIVNSSKDFILNFKNKNFYLNKQLKSYLYKKNQSENLSYEEFSFYKTVTSSDNDFINESSISINTGFFPYINNKNKTIVSITLPKNFEAIINGYKTLNKIMDNNNVNFIFELDSNIHEYHLFASRDYKIQKKTLNNIEYITTFFKEHDKLCKEFINKSNEYIRKYEKKFDTNFPFKKFIIIEDESSEGYSIPGAIVFSKKITHLPFVINRSLSHEILHQWFGNAIECNMKDGNWTEAITTFYSDYEIEKNKAEARKNILSNYKAYVKKPYPISEFKGNYSKIDQSIGYGKGLMLLYMAQNIVGEEIFSKGVKKFIKDKINSSASWEDLINYLGMNKEFYNFWIHNKNIININIRNLEYKNNTLTFNFIRKNGIKEIKIPYTYISDNKTYKEYFISKLGTTKFSKQINNDNDTLYIDSDYELMRNLFVNEIEPSFMYLYGADSINFIGTKEEYKDFKNEFNNIEKHIDLDNLKPKHIENQNLIISMHHIVPEFIARYFIPYISFSPELGRLVYKTIQNPYSNGEKFVLLVLNYDNLTLKKLKHYGNETNLVFNSNKELEEKYKSKSNQGILVYNNKMFKGANK